MSSQLLVIGVLAVTVSFGMVMVHFLTRRRAFRAVVDRPPLSEKEFALLFPQPAEARVAGLVRSALTPLLKIPVELVRPDDLLCHDLRLGDAGIDEPETFLEGVTRATGVEIPVEVAAKARTLRDIIQFVAPRMKGEQSKHAG